MAHLFKTMSCRNKLFVVTLLLALAQCQASHIDDGDSKKAIGTTLAPVLNHSPILETTLKPEGLHKLQASTLHPLVTVESVKSTKGGNNHATSNSSPPITDPSPSVDPMKLNAKMPMGLDPLHRLCDYLKPVCNSTDKMTPKQLGKIQNQFRRIIQSSGGKLGFCFLDHFNFDPNLNPINKTELVTICRSKDLPSDLKGSYKSFEVCAGHNWDVAVDNELDKILAARANCTKNHNHGAKDEAVASLSLMHEDDHDDDLSLISAVVNRVFEDNKGHFANTSDVKFIDVSGPMNGTGKLGPGGHPASGMKERELSKQMTKEAFMNDPNTVMVLLDDSNTKTTMAPMANKTVSQLQTISSNKNSTMITTLRPATVIGDSVLVGNKTIETAGHSLKDKKLPEKSPLGEKSNSKISDTIESGAKKVSSSSSTSLGSMPHKEATVKPASLAPAKLVTEAPSSIVSSRNMTTLEPVKTKLSTVKPIIFTTTPKPVIQTLEEILRRQEKEKKDLEDRLRAEREQVMRELQKRQDEIDAQNAIRALQYQREASTNQHSDAKLHQLEHDRQMAIDPIGHTIKHQQYEYNKQQRMMNGRK